MPVGKKKSTSEQALSLQAGAKEFVPSSLQPSTTPNNPDRSRTVHGSIRPNAPTVTTSHDIKKEPPKAPAPVRAAWGSNPSAAVKQAAPIKPQQPIPAQKSQQPTQGSQKQHQKHPSGPRGADSSGGRKKIDKSGGKKQNDPAPRSTATPVGTGSWARAAAKQGPATGKLPGGGTNHRHSQSRGGSGTELTGENDSAWTRGKVLPIDLLGPGEGTKDAEIAVTRVGVQDLLAIRLNYLAPPTTWSDGSKQKPPAECLWDSSTRIADIEKLSKAPRTGGDVVFPPKGLKRGEGSGKGDKNPAETAPPIEDCKPIEINEETRWKAKVFESNNPPAEEFDSKEEVTRKALLILNKLSLTKFDKLSEEFINCGIGRDIECLTEAVGLIVGKAQEEQHFSSMYAGLCLKLANTPFEGIDDGNSKGKKFKKILLTRCQTEFETETSVKIGSAIKDITDEEEIKYHCNLIKKHYLGHMRFIGELYKGDLINIKIMLSCIPQLLMVDEPSKLLDENEENTKESSGKLDEEKVECFVKLMTVIGSSLEKQSEDMKNVGKKDAAERLAECWKKVEVLAGRGAETEVKVSNRIKFILQDLLELKKNGWVTRRTEDSAKTIAQIHSDVAREEQARRSSSSNVLRGMSKVSFRRGVSSGDVRVLEKAQSKPQLDQDGFMSVTSSKTVQRSTSMTALQRSQSEGGWQKYNARGSTVIAKRGSSSKITELNEFETQKTELPLEDTPEHGAMTYLSPDVCAEKAKRIVKEFFVGGDIDDAVLSLHELVGAGDQGSVARGAKVVEGAILLVLEMKNEDVDKFLSLYLRCSREGKIEGGSFVLGLQDPLEFLNDISTDAPLAISHLIRIIAELVKAEIILFEFLLNAPAYFRTDQSAAMFGARVLKHIGGDAMISDEFTEVVETLMTEADKAAHGSARDIISAA